MFVISALSSLIEASYRMTYLRECGVRLSAVVIRCVTAPVYSGENMASIIWQDDTGSTGKSGVMVATRLPVLGSKINVYADPDHELPAIWEGEFR